MSADDTTPPWELFSSQPEPDQAPDFSSFGKPVGDLDFSGLQRVEPEAAEPAPRQPRFGWAPDVEDALESAAREHGVDRSMLDAFARIESGGRPRVQTGSYKGLFQLSDTEFRKHGGQADPFDPYENARAGAAKIRAESAAFAKTYGRDPTAAELYLIHQQGVGGAAAHWGNPNAPAWQNMASTLEGRQRGAAWARKAIWGNIPDTEKRRFGNVDNVTSRDFTKLWEDKVARFGGASSSAALPVASGPAATAPAAKRSLGAMDPNIVASAQPGQRMALGGPLSTSDDEEPDDQFLLDQDDDDEQDDAPAYLGGPKEDLIDDNDPAGDAPPDFSKFGKPVGQVPPWELFKDGGKPDFSKFGKPVAGKPASKDGVGDGFAENVTNPQQYKEFGKSVIPGAISMQGTALQMPDAAISGIQHRTIERAKQQLAVMDRIDAGEKVEDFQAKGPRANWDTDDYFGYQQMTPEQRATQRARLEKEVAEFNPTPIQDRTLYKAGEAVQEFSKGKKDDWYFNDAMKALAPKEGYEKSVGRQLGEGLGSMVGGMPYGFLGRVPAGLFFGAAGAGEATQRAVEFDKKERKEGREGLTQEQIALAGVMGIAPGTTDLLPLETLMGRLPIPVPEAAKKPLAQAIARIGGQAFIEGLQEGGQQFLQNLIAREVYNPKQELGDEVLGNTGIGAGVGGIAQTGKEVGSGLVKLAGGRRGRHAGSAQDAPADDQSPEAPLPAPAAPASAERPPAASTDELGWLRARGFDDDAIAEMSPGERAAEIEEAKASGVRPVPAKLAPDNPTAEPLVDLVAQAQDLADPDHDRSGLYIPLSGLHALPDANVEKLSELIDGRTFLENFDNRGGLLVVNDEETAQQAIAAKARGEPLQTIIGRVTGAGSGKPADGNIVVQQRTRDGGVARETLTTQADLASVKADFAAPGRTVVTMTPQEALDRRSSLIEDQGTGSALGTRAAPVDVRSAEDLAIAGERAAEPTEAQAAVGNYAKGHIRLHGLDISIETPKGGIRRGPGWEAVSPAAYGYIKGVSARSPDGEHVDVYVGNDPTSDRVFVVNQADATTKRFDEAKAIFGVRSRAEAIKLYDAAFSDGKGPQRRQAIHEMSVDEFRDLLETHDFTKPVGRSPDFSAGATAPTNVAHVLAEADVALSSGERYDIAPAVVEETLSAVANHTGMLPAGTSVGALESIEAANGLLLSDTDPVRATFRTTDGRAFSITLPWQTLTSVRAFATTTGARVGFVRFASSAGKGVTGQRDAADTRVGELIHESIHVLRRRGLLTGDRWAALLRHAKSLRLLDGSLASYLEMVGDSSARKATGTIREAYTRLYHNQPDLVERINQEYVAHLAELYSRGRLDGEIPAGIAGILDDLVASQPDATVNIKPARGRSAVPNYAASAQDEDPDGTWQDMAQDAYAQDLAIERRNTAPASRPRAAAAEKLAKEDQLGRRVDRLMARVRRIEDKGRDARLAPKAIAEQIHAETGVTVEPEQIGSSDAWWRMQSKPGAGRRYTEDERRIFAEGYAAGRPIKEIVAEIAMRSGRRMSARNVGKLAEAAGIKRNRHADRQALWSREANLRLARLDSEGKSVAQIAEALSTQFGKPYTGAAVEDQIRQMRAAYRPAQTARDYGAQWQPEALELLKSLRGSGMSFAAMARQIEEETGQVVSRSAVAGMLDRLRIEEQRAALREDLSTPDFAVGEVGRAQRRELDRLGFYSKALEAAKDWRQPKGTPEQLRSWLRSNQVKEAEIKAMRLDDFLAGKSSVSKSEVVSFLRENRVQVTEAKYADTYSLDDAAMSEFGRPFNQLATPAERNRSREVHTEGLKGRPPTKWAPYSIDPSNPTYRETVIHLPESGTSSTELDDRLNSLIVQRDELEAAYSSEASPSEISEIEAVDAEISTVRAALRQRANQTFFDLHWQEPNPVGHIRSQIILSADGKRYLNGDNIQSAWQQTYRDSIRNAVAHKLFNVDFQSLSPDERVAASKEIARMRKAGEPLQGVRDETKIAGLRARLKAAKAENERIEEEAEEFVAPYGNMAANAVSKMHLAYEQVAYGVAGDLQGLMRHAPDESIRVSAAQIYEAWKTADSLESRLRAELETADRDDRVPEHPLIEGTDLNLTFMLKNFLRQAIEAGVDGISFTPGHVLSSRGEGDDNPAAMAKWMDETVPRAMRDLLRTYDKSTAEPVDQAMQSPVDGRKLTYRDEARILRPHQEPAIQFHTFPLTDKVKESVMEDGQPLFAIGGIKGARRTAKAGNPQVLRAYQNAQRLADTGTSPEAIWRAAGWMQGPEGKWRFEIDDSKAVITLPKPPKIRTWKDRVFSVFRAARAEPAPRLGSMLNHPALYAAYPSLKDLRVSFHEAGPDGSASVGRKMDGTLLMYPLSIRADVVRDAKRFRHVLLHEIQHYIQEIEGFAVGSAPNQENTRKSTKFTAKMPIMSVATKAIGARAEDNFSNLFGTTQGEALVADYVAKREAGDEEAAKDIYRQIIQLARVGSEDYLRSAGEQESELVASRADMTASQRRMSMPELAGFVGDTTREPAEIMDELYRRAGFRERRNQREAVSVPGTDLMMTRREDVRWSRGLRRTLHDRLEFTRKGSDDVLVSGALFFGDGESAPTLHLSIDDEGVNVSADDLRKVVDYARRTFNVPGVQVDSSEIPFEQLKTWYEVDPTAVMDDMRLYMNVVREAVKAEIGAEYDVGLVDANSTFYLMRNGEEVWDGRSSAPEDQAALEKFREIYIEYVPVKSTAHDVVGTDRAIRKDAMWSEYITNAGGPIGVRLDRDPEARGAWDAEQPLFAIQAFHGSPHDFKEFSLSHLGRGEGAQAFGPGLYFAENIRVAKSYASKLGPRQIAQITLDGSPVGVELTPTPEAVAARQEKIRAINATEMRHGQLQQIAANLSNGKGYRGTLAEYFEDYPSKRYRKNYYASEHREIRGSIDQNWANDAHVSLRKDGSRAITFDYTRKGRNKAEWRRHSTIVVDADGVIREVGSRFSAKDADIRLEDLIGFDQAYDLMQSKGGTIKSTYAFGAPNKYDSNNTPALRAAKALENATREKAIALQESDVADKAAYVASFSNLNPFNSEHRRRAEKALVHSRQTLRHLQNGTEEKGTPFAELAAEARKVEAQRAEDIAWSAQQSGEFIDKRFKAEWLQEEGFYELPGYKSRQAFERAHDDARLIANDKTISDRELAEEAGNDITLQVAVAIRELRQLEKDGRLTWTQTQPENAGLYQVQLHVEPDQLLDWDKPLSQQSPYVSTALKSVVRIGFLQRLKGIFQRQSTNRFGLSGKGTVSDLIWSAKDKDDLRKMLLAAGIPGIRYFDAISRKDGDGSRNYVIFDDTKIEITHKNGSPVSAADKASLIEEMKQPSYPGFDDYGNMMFSLIGRSDSPISPEVREAVSKDLTEAINIISRIAGREVDVQFVDRLEADEVPQAQRESTEAAGFSSREAGGAYRPATLSARAVIALATQAEDFDLATTAGHEAWHHVETALANAAEKRLLSIPREMARMRGWAAQELGLETGDPRVSELLDAEVRAIAFQRYRRERDAGNRPDGIHIGIRRFWDRVLQIFSAVRNAIEGHGLRTFEDVFEAARTGEMATRPAQIGEDADAYMASLIPAVIRQQTVAALASITPKFVRSQWARLPNSDEVRRALQDQMIYVRRLEEQKAIQAGSAVPIHLSTYIASRLYPKAGEAQVDNANNFLEPMKDVLRKNGISIEAFGDYLYARHAKERNDAIRKIDPTNPAGSGMTDAEASQILAAARSKQAAYDAAAQFVDQMLTDTRQRLLRAGLIDQQTHDTWKNQYQHYVPLRGFEAGDDKSDTARIGRGFDIRGPEAIQALGRRSKADNPVFYALLQANQAIVRSEKNRVDKTLYRFIQAYPDPQLYQIYKGEQRRRLNPVTRQVETYWVQPAFARNDNVHGVKIGGKQFYMELKDPNLARAMRGIGGTQTGPVMSGAMKLARLYSSLLTSYNPEFVVSNFFRDIQTALANITDVANKPADIRRQILKEAGSLKSMRGIMAALYSHDGRTIFGTKRAADETLLGTKRTQGAEDYAKWFEEYRHAGGKISFMEFNDVASIQRDIERSLKRGRFSRVTRKALEHVNNLNTAVENGVRLSTYIALRKHGVEMDRAAMIARDLTVDFNLKGEMSSQINALYLFFNASVQGSTRMLRAIGSSRKLQIAVASIMGAAFMVDWWNYLVAGDDDDGKNAYDKIPAWIKERNMIFMVPGAKDRSYIQIPMPYGYNLFWLGGQQTAAMIRGSVKPHEAALNIAKSTFEVFSPIGGANGSFLQLLSPTMLDPMVQIVENKTWYGGPIYPQKFNKNQPDSETFTSSINPWFVEVARKLNRLDVPILGIKGGNMARSGTLDVSPEVLEHLVEFAGGGVGKFMGNVVKSGHRAYDGEEWLPEKTPFVRRLYGKATTESRRADFWKEWNTVDAAHYEIDNLIKGARKGKSDRDEIQAARERNQIELQAYPQFRAAQQYLAQIRKQRTEAQLDGNLSRSEREAKIRELTERENVVILRSLNTLNQLRKQAAPGGAN